MQLLAAMQCLYRYNHSNFSAAVHKQVSPVQLLAIMQGLYRYNQANFASAVHCVQELVSNA
jgi:hypothetical protein